MVDDVAEYLLETEIKQLKVENEMLKAPLWAVMWCPCIFESADTLSSLHRSKAAAYKAIRAYLYSAWVDYRNECIMHHDIMKTCDTENMPQDLYGTSWTIEKVEVEEEIL